MKTEIKVIGNMLTATAPEDLERLKNLSSRLNEIVEVLTNVEKNQCIHGVALNTPCDKCDSRSVSDA